jgi:hypothetical protein
MVVSELADKKPFLKMVVPKHVKDDRFKMSTLSIILKGVIKPQIFIAVFT